MEIGIIGLPGSGKTTVFNAVTRGRATVAGYSDKPNVGIAKIPDGRVDTLARMYLPRRVVSAEVGYTDIPPSPEGFGKTRGIGGDYLNALQAMDALMIVARAFDNPAVPHIDETVDVFRDINNMLLEITFSDYDVVDRRLRRIKENYRRTKVEERDALERESILLQRIITDLDKGVALRNQEISSEEEKQTIGFGLLSGKPIIIVMNVDGEQFKEATKLEDQLEQEFSGKHIRVAVICAQLEMELGQMDVHEEQEFRDGLSAGESSLNRMVRLSYDVVGQISFFTVGEDEVRAWEIPRGTVANRAAGKIHSDLQRGFIRAEVIGYDDLVDCGGIGEAKKRGLVRQEGKDYVVKDGEIMHVLFNV